MEPTHIFTFHPSQHNNHHFLVGRLAWQPRPWTWRLATICPIQRPWLLVFWFFTFLEVACLFSKIRWLSFDYYWFFVSRVSMATAWCVFKKNLAAGSCFGRCHCSKKHQTYIAFLAKKRLQKKYANLINNEQLFNKVFSLLIFSVSFPPGNVCWVCMTHLVDQVDRASLKAHCCHWMQWINDDIPWKDSVCSGESPLFWLGLADKGEKSIDASGKIKTTTKNWIFDFILKLPKTPVNMKKNCRPFGGAVEFQWSCWIMYLELAVQNCGELSQYLAHIV